MLKDRYNPLIQAALVSIVAASCNRGAQEVPQPFPQTPVIMVEPSPTRIIVPSSTPEITRNEGVLSFILDPRAWEIIAPTGSPRNPDVFPLSGIDLSKTKPWLEFSSDKKALRFEAPVTGPTTRDSQYPHTILRETTLQGLEASWNSEQGTHHLFLDQAISAVPQNIKRVVAGQIHNASHDISTIRLEYPTLYVTVNGEKAHILNSSYKLRERFTVEFVVANGVTTIFYNGKAVFAFQKNYEGAFFEAGAFVLSNCSNEGSSELCNETNIGAVEIYNAWVFHQ